jgi:hypothetical protein
MDAGVFKNQIHGYKHTCPTFFSRLGFGTLNLGFKDLRYIWHAPIKLNWQQNHMVVSYLPSIICNFFL